MTEKRLNHKLDVSKIKTLKDVRNIFDGMNLYACVEEDNEKYELLKEYFTIPNKPQEFKFEYPRKSLEQIQQEFDEKIDKLIEDTKTKFYGYKTYAESRYERKFDKIFDDFEYAKEHGQFPVRLSVGNLDCSKLVANGSTISTSFQIRQGGNEVGYYTNGNGYLRYYLPEKPNAITRWFMKNCLSLVWVDQK